MQRAATVHSYIAAKDVRSLKNFDVNEWESLQKIGIHINGHNVRQMMHGKKAMDSMIHSMDSLQPLVTTASINTPVQFLQNWLPGFVLVATAARKIDDLTGVMTTGSWEDEQIVQGIMERVGTSQIYGDYSNVPLSSWNVNFNYRTVVRFEEGIKVGVLEAARAARLRVDDSGMKRKAAAQELDIQRNAVGFFGFNSGDNNTYGFLNDPGLPSYVQVATGVAGFTWAVKTFLEIQSDIVTAIQTLRTQSQDTIDVETVDLTLAVATAAVDYLSKTSNFGISVRAWLSEAYPRIRVVSAPQLNAANSSDNVFYLYADRILDESTDGGATIIQMVPSKFYTLGVQQEAKAYTEDFSNATAGIMVKRPYAFVRYYDI
jgi:hypothetical protein